MRESLLGNLAHIQTGPFGSQLHKEDYVMDGTPIVTVEHLGSRYFSTQNLPCVNAKDKARLIKYILKEGDIVFSRVGSVDRCSYVDTEYSGWMFSGRCLRVRSKEEIIDSEFLYYYFTQKTIKQFIRNIAVGATMPSINTSLLSQVSIKYPSLPKQRAIAATLSCLDKKIELNNKINANLEAQARSIFKSWFVDFEPFQDGGFVESELGMIPKGWRVGVLSELINVKYGKDHKKLGDGTIPVYGSGGIMRYAEKALYERESVLIPRKGTLNNVIYINKPFWTVDTMFYSEMRHPHIAKFIYFLVSSKNLASMNSGSAVPSMTTDILNNLLTPIAPDSIFYEYDRLVSPLFNAIHKNTKQSNTLAALRDTLLPKLMSGEIGVPMEESM